MPFRTNACGHKRFFALPFAIVLSSLVMMAACQDTYDNASFMATHNSYSGGARGSIPDQLDHGVRLMELDIHLDDFQVHGYRVGHDGPGDGVSHESGNPLTDDLEEWLGVVAAWSDTNPNHAPITILTDFKDSLSGIRSFEEGNHAAFNELLRRRFAEKLFEAESFTGTWPLVEDLRNRILAVMSGNEDARLAYLRDKGSEPSVDMNRDGSVVELHDSGSGNLWYWTGAYEESGMIRWKRHGWAGTGQKAALALNRAGWVVSAYETYGEEETHCSYRVGRLSEGPEIEWITGQGMPFPGSGPCHHPTLRFQPSDGNTLNEVHQNGATGENWIMEGTLNVDTGEVAWNDPDPSPETPLHDKTTVSLEDGRTVSVFTGAYGLFGNDTLLYSTDKVDQQRIRYEQVAFSEHQLGGNLAFAVDGAPFYATNADNAFGRFWASIKRFTGGIVRLWGFNDASHKTTPPVNFPATDVPFQSWYVEYADEIGTVE